ncbi:hypothetical protein D3OALGB2SA_5501 [Olavius algarvensis associated proteobacterium Delta 3]|nr:hypothetical protein D3OALGB2SA_5501 [Olavius algarvensis associated proteobacterium Delta 3]
MRLPRFHHLTGVKAWMHCDHQNTQLDETQAAAKLSYNIPTADRTDFDPTVFQDWHDAVGGAVFHYFSPDSCQTGTPLVLNRKDGQLYILDEHHRWVSLQETYKRVLDETVEFVFSKQPPENFHAFKFDTPRSLSRAYCGDYWLLEAGNRQLIRLSSADFSITQIVTWPAGANLMDIGATSWGLVAIDTDKNTIWRLPKGGTWTSVDLAVQATDPPVGLDEFRPVSVSGGPVAHALVLLRPRSVLDKGFWIAVICKDTIEFIQLAGMHNPWPLFLIAEDLFLVGEIGHRPDDKKKMIFKKYKLDVNSRKAILLDYWAVWNYDGRGLLLDPQDNALATTSTGVRPLYLHRNKYATDGRVETFALDSTIFGCQWHRIFIDVCLPNGTSIEVHARTSDELPPESMRRKPQPYANNASQSWKDYPLGSITVDDDEQWVPLGRLDERSPHADIIFSPIFNALPSDDPFLRKAETAPDFNTLEGLVKNSVGRYLWLRIKLRGTQKKSPIVYALRATYQRPSLLDHLPAYWRADPDTTIIIEQALALFEGNLTEIDQRLEDIRHLFNAKTCPPDALEWLASFIAMTLDPRLSESVKRRLLLEMTQLYRQRGTLPGLERLLSILSEAKIAILEGFRLRGHRSAFIGATGETSSFIGGGAINHDLRLGGYERGPGDETRWEPWEIELMQTYESNKQWWDLQKRLFDETSVETDAPCPGRKPRPPVNTDPYISFHRRYAHRFSVLVFRTREEQIADILEQATENNKPAHTLHRLCWLDAGFRLGSNAYLGIGTQITEGDAFRPPVLNQATLAGQNLLG